MNYFKECKNSDDVKRLYREWAKKLHPDAGGRAEDMIELQRQYETWKEPSPFGQSFRDHVNESDREATNEFYRKYGGYGGYKYANQGSMWNEYKQQSNDPRLADYERMKSDYNYMKNVYAGYENLERLYLNLQSENDALKKKLERLKKKLTPSLKQPSKKKKKDLESVISL